MTISIEPIRIEHIEGYYRVEDIVSRERKHMSNFDAGPISNYYDVVPKQIAKNVPRFVALSNAEVVGWCQIVPSSHAAHRHVGGLDIGILPEYRGQGLGKRLLEATMAAARKLGLTRIDLAVFSGNDPALALYRRCGFQQEGCLRDAVLIDGVYRDIVLMAVIDHEGRAQ